MMIEWQKEVTYVVVWPSGKYPQEYDFNYDDEEETTTEDRVRDQELSDKELIFYCAVNNVLYV